MKISSKAEYACLAVLALAQAYPSAPPLRIREIADRHGIPSRYLVQILLQLKGAGLVHSTRGAAGGYHLARSPEEISVGEVLDAIEGPVEPVTPRDPDSPAAQALADVWQAAAEARREVLERTSFAELIAAARPREWVI